ncbi:MAG: FecR domain-containing protein [Bryobacteraceae bacterium]|nr:FecR domain-containing protein [Bryobacteraceae bacterium]
MKAEFESINDPVLDGALAEIRNDEPDAVVVEAAAARVWAKLQAETNGLAAQHPESHVLRSCTDFQKLFAEYRAGTLAEAQRMLVEDHVHECVACRKTLEAMSRKLVAMPAPKRRKSLWQTSPAVRWATAAAVAVGVGLGAWNLYIHAPNAARASSQVASVKGELYRVSGDALVPLKPGDTVSANAEIRTAKDSGATVRLSDGSMVEMRERSGLTVSATFRDTTIQLSRGGVIVEAAKQKSGNLFVLTPDVKVAVKGTVFSVNAGQKGSRVSVIEGKVQVTQSSKDAMLTPGMQYSSSLAVTPIPVSEDIAWSAQVDKHLALLREFADLKKQLESVRLPDLRYSSRLLDLVPASTVVYASLPNLGPTLADAHRIFAQKVQQSPALREWWESKGNHSNGLTLQQTVDEIRAFSDYLGDEIVLAAVATDKGGVDAPVFAAEVKRQGFREFVEAEIRKIAPEARDVKLHFAESAAAIGAAGEQTLTIYFAQGVVAVSPSTRALREVALSIEGAPRFSSTPNYARIQQAYRDGAGIVFSADLDRIVGSKAGSNAEQHSNFLMGGMKQVLIEQKQVNGATNTSAQFSFQGERKGLAAWLGRPATLSSLDFVSPEATVVSSFALRSPATIVDELLSLLGRSNERFNEERREQETKLGIDIRNDIAATLGGDITIAFDGPVFPVPSWKIAVEVYNPQRLEGALQRLANATGATYLQEAVNGRTYYRIASPQLAKFGEIHYTFYNGFLIAAPSRVLVEQAMGYRANGTSLARTRKFQDLIPRDSYASFSGLLYHNLGSTFGPLLEGFANSAPLNSEQRQAMQNIAGDMQPLLVGIYAEDDRIRVATTSATLGLNAANLISMQGPMGLAGMLQGRGRR